MYSKQNIEYELRQESLLVNFNVCLNVAGVGVSIDEAVLDRDADLYIFNKSGCYAG